MAALTQPPPTAFARPQSAKAETAWLTVGQALFITIVIGAFLIRVWDVGARAMHLDESTVAWFGWQLLQGHGYSYDPVYHGPFQHEMLALLFLVFEPSQTTARMLAVVMGTALVALPWFIRDYLGRAAALLACFLIAVSPSFVYFARFERDDTYMEFFTFLLVVFALRFVRDRKPWQLYGAVLAFALAFATKESIYIVGFIFGTYLAFRWLGLWLGARSGPDSTFKPQSTAPDGESVTGASPPGEPEQPTQYGRHDSAPPAGFQGRVSPGGWFLALCLLAPLAVGLIVTINTGSYPPVPAVIVVEIA